MHGFNKRKRILGNMKKFFSISWIISSEQKTLILLWSNLSDEFDKSAQRVCIVRVRTLMFQPEPGKMLASHTGDLGLIPGRHEIKKCNLTVWRIYFDCSVLRTETCIVWSTKVVHYQRNNRQLYTLNEQSVPRLTWSTFPKAKIQVGTSENSFHSSDANIQASERWKDNVECQY